MPRILVGTASWTDPGFVQHWYPKTLPAPDRLKWYAERFELVEVNSTFYRIPDSATLAKWSEQTPDGFVFDLKLHRLLSHHSTSPEMLPPGLRRFARVKNHRVELTGKLEQAVARRFRTALEPLRQSGKLGALLLQLSPEFSPRKHKLEELDATIELLRGENLAVELRNRGWVAPHEIEKTRTFFEKRKLAFVMVDGPDDPHFMVMPNIDLVTNRKLAYLRAHGRNAPGYVRGRTVAARFDYDYPKPELEEIAGRALEAADQAQEVHVIYNNNKADYAPKAAQSFKHIVGELLGGASPGRAAREEVQHA